ncbi:IPT/TIG domain-containing protein [Proteiniphilum sp. UBA5384]|uniref:IPT/TIG domain-containing protein n=1 Tax=Proteiniphilum sp. UBA5384 TaxID=1947279 RepID=UPI0025E3FD18|nr:IPT/TIG domain-containing protein [Proteiniphilum sp. UBA5384]MDD2299801.1 IPT/TIG domain-containing protein [Fermentimonas sp.]
MKSKYLKNKKLIIPLWNLFLCVFIVELAACKSDNDVGGKEFDPSKDVVITAFSPDSGSARSKMFLYGENFGTDTTKISVSIGGKKAPLVGCDGECIYCLVPAGSQEGTIEVRVKDDLVEKSAKAENRFRYVSRTVVSTLCGYMTSEGKYEIKDGTFEECGFGAPYWLSIDPKNNKHLFLLEQNLSLRLLDIEKSTVTTLVTLGEANWKHPRTLAWSLSGDTLYVANDQDGETSVGVTMLTRSTGFKVPQTLVFYRNINHVSVNPVDGTIFFSTWWAGELFRYDWDQKKAVHAGNNGLLEYHVMFHPSGNYAYVFSPWNSAIQRASYNWEEKTLDPPTTFVGGGGNGYVDGVGTAAKVAMPYQGVFVKNEEYIREGKEDIYDFYLIEAGNHCIRIITPEGKVTTFAGRGSKGLDNNTWGYVDGELRKEARFRDPWGIEYDEKTKTFYIADMNNHRIRMISMDE